MNTKLRNLSILAVVLVMSAVVLSAVSAQQDATSTEEPGAASTAEATTPEPAAQHPFLGVSLQDTDNGVTVADVLDGSAAADAGFQVGDVITAINGTAIATVEDAKTAIAALNVGDAVTVDVTRGSETMTLTATLGAQTPEQMMQPTRPGRGDGRGNLGMNMGRTLGLSYDATNQTWTITQLSEDSPLYTAGLREGDVITAIDGEAVDPASLFQHLQSLSSDATVTVTVERDGASQDIQVSVSDLSDLVGMGVMRFGMDEMPHNFSQQMPMFSYGNGRLGVTFQTIDAQVAQANNLSVTEGALITEVADSSPAADAGLLVNDVITAVNNEAVDEEHTLRDRLIAYEPGDTITLSVLRDGASQDIQVTLGQPMMSDMSDMFQNFLPFRGGNGGFPFDNTPAQEATPEVVPNA